MEIWMKCNIPISNDILRGHCWRLESTSNTWRHNVVVSIRSTIWHLEFVLDFTITSYSYPSNYYAISYQIILWNTLWFAAYHFLFHSAAAAKSASLSDLVSITTLRHHASKIRSDVHYPKQCFMQQAWIKQLKRLKIEITNYKTELRHYDVVNYNVVHKVFTLGFLFQTGFLNWFLMLLKYNFTGWNFHVNILIVATS